MGRRHEGDIHELRTDAIHPRARVGEPATGPAHVAGTVIEFVLFPHDPMGHAPLSDAEWADRVAVRMRARWGLRHKLAWAPRPEHAAPRPPRDGIPGAARSTSLMPAIRSGPPAGAYPERSIRVGSLPGSFILRRSFTA